MSHLAQQVDHTLFVGNTIDEEEDSEEDLEEEENIEGSKDSEDSMDSSDGPMYPRDTEDFKL